MQTKELPIGVFDSGAGGVSVLAQAKICLPHENFIYYGDSANALTVRGRKMKSETLRLPVEIFCAGRA